MLSRGRLVRGARPAEDAETRTSVTSDVGPARRIARATLRATDEARTILAATERRAAGILRAATDDAERIRTQARDEGRAAGFAEAAALALALRQKDDRADEAALDRVLALAKLLAERLLREELVGREESIFRLARTALDEARGARRVTLRTHPADAAILGAAVAPFDAEGRVHAVVADAALERGDFVLETEVGTVDARLGAGLERLAERLREALRS